MLALEEARRRIPEAPPLRGLVPMSADTSLFDELADLDEDFSSLVIDTGMATVKVGTNPIYNLNSFMVDRKRARLTLNIVSLQSFFRDSVGWLV